MARYKLALIGAGRRGAGAHLPVFPVLSDTFEFVAICDIDREVAERYARQYGVRAYTNLREMVANEELDVVDVTVPAPAHHAVCVYLARHGIHALCETPIAPTRRLADMMIQAAQENSTVLEIAENYYRAPIERFKSEVIRAGVIGDVSRIYRIFHEGGYHGMSIIRIRAGGNPVQILGIAHQSPVIRHTDRMRRTHTQENWSLGYLDFDNGVAAVMIYSNVIHARSLGRKMTGIAQIDGTEGAIVEDTVYVVPPEELETGAVGRPYQPVRVTRQVDGVTVLDRIELQLPDRTIVWENPYRELPLREGQIAVADELMSVARALDTNGPPEYGAQAGRLDQEMNLAMGESARRGRATLQFPLEEETAAEIAIHQGYPQQYGCEAEDIEGLLDVFFPRR
ncbi:MAG: hypothetical protein KatS3mg115_0439 [Candidatus Poribacteria bacterium]|nr:MAG: hypothetical protein KatS3mg115_0439 [Candidatus Poribacteria bacterium]